MRRNRSFLLIAALLALLLTACTSRPDLSGLPKLELLTDTEGQKYILLDDLRYDRVPFEVIGSLDSGRWDLHAQIGRRVAMLGQDTICTVQGDQEELFLYGVAETFRFGGINHYIFLREGTPLTLPEGGADFDRGTIRTYASGGLFGKRSVVTCEFTDEALLTALFDCWNGTAETPPVPDGLDPEKRESRSLELWSREYPWLGFHVSCSLWPDGLVTITGREGGSVRLPEELAGRLTWEEPGLWDRLTGGRG